MARFDCHLLLPAAAVAARRLLPRRPAWPLPPPPRPPAAACPPPSFAAVAGRPRAPALASAPAPPARPPPRPPRLAAPARPASWAASDRGRGGALFTALNGAAAGAEFGGQIAHWPAAGDVFGFAIVLARRGPVFHHRRQSCYNVSHQGYVTTSSTASSAFGLQFVFVRLRLRDPDGPGRGRCGAWWWLAAVPCFVAFTLVPSFVSPYLVPAHLADRDPEPEGRKRRRWSGSRARRTPGSRSRAGRPVHDSCPTPSRRAWTDPDP